jgi:hypothetical protein
MPREHTRQIKLHSNPERRRLLAKSRTHNDAGTSRAGEPWMPAQSVVYEPVLPAVDGAWSPHVDVRELPDEYTVLAHFPASNPAPSPSPRRGTP